MTKKHFEPFFDKNDVIKLGETFTSPGTYCWLQAGRKIATLHTMGLTNSDMHRENWGLDSWGDIYYLDVGDWREAEITPIVVAESLVPLYMTLDRYEFIALLTGYLTQSIVYIDPNLPDFTENLLKLFGGSFKNVPEPRSESDEYEIFAKFFKIFLSGYNDDARINFKKLTSSDLRYLWNNFSTDIVSICSYMILTGVDFSFLIPNKEILLRLNEPIKSMADFLICYQKGSPEDLKSIFEKIEKDNWKTKIALSLILVLKANWGYPNTSNSPIKYPLPVHNQPDYMSRAVLSNIMKGKLIGEKKPYINALVDFTSYVAISLDSLIAKNLQYRKIGSKVVEFAQHAFWILQDYLIDSEDIEKQFLSISKYQSDLKCLDGLESYRLSKIIYLDTISNTYNRAFINFMKSKKMIWSFLWDSLAVNGRLKLSHFRS